MLGLVKSIVVGERIKVEGEPTTQDLEISYRFIGSLLSDTKEDAAVEANVLSGAAV